VARGSSSLGELERALLDLLWAAEEPLSAYQLLELLPERSLAPTTVLTVLSRLERKGFVATERGARPHLFRAVGTRAEHAAELMHQILGDGADRLAVLEHFVGGVAPAEAEALRRLLPPAP